MPRKLGWMILGIVGVTVCVVAMVRAQDAPTPAGVVPVWGEEDSASRGRRSLFGSGLADRIQSVRENEEPAAARTAPSRPAPVQPAPIQDTPLQAGPPAAYDAGVSSVLKRPGEPASSSPAPATPAPVDTSSNPATEDSGASRYRPAEIADERVSSRRQAFDSVPPTNPYPTEPRGEAVPSPTSGSADLFAPSRPAAAPAPSTPPRTTESATTGRTLPPARDLTGGAVSLVNSQSPAIQLEAKGPKAVVINKEAVYEVQLVNGSALPADGVEVVLELPGSVELVTAETTAGGTQRSPAGADTTTVNWLVNRIAAQAREKLTLRVIPRSNRPFSLEVDWHFVPTRGSALVEVQEPKLEMTVSGPKDILFGETKLYTITLNNPGTGDAENVIVTLLPLMPGTDRAATSNIGVLAAGQRKDIQVELTAREAGMIAIRAEAAADGGLQASAAEEVLVRRANLSLQVEGPPLQYAGTRAQYRVRLLNDGNATAQGVSLQAVLPNGARLVSAGPSAQPDSTGSRANWNLGALSPGAARDFTVECELALPGDNRFEVRAVGESNLAGSAALLTRVEALADLKLTVNDPQGPRPIGQDVVYEVVLVNRGTKAAENVDISAYFSHGIEPVSVEGISGELLEGQVQFRTIARIEAGQELKARITARADQPGNHEIRIEVECENPETRLLAQDSTRFFNTAAAAEGAPEDRFGTRPAPPQQLLPVPR